MSVTNLPTEMSHQLEPQGSFFSICESFASEYHDLLPRQPDVAACLVAGYWVVKGVDMDLRYIAAQTKDGQPAHQWYVTERSQRKKLRVFDVFSHAGRTSGLIYDWDVDSAGFAFDTEHTGERLVQDMLGSREFAHMVRAVRKIRQEGEERLARLFEFNQIVVAGSVIDLSNENRDRNCFRKPLRLAEGFLGQAQSTFPLTYPRPLGLPAPDSTQSVEKLSMK